MSLREAVQDATDANESIGAADVAAVSLALAYADTIDEALESGDALLATKALYLGPHLLNALTALGCTPAGRKDVAAAIKDGKTTGKASGLGKFRVVS